MMTSKKKAGTSSRVLILTILIARRAKRVSADRQRQTAGGQRLIRSRHSFAWRDQERVRPARKSSTSLAGDAGT